MPHDVYMQPDAPDPVLTDEVVLDLVRRHMPDALAVTGVDESGGEARTYAIDADVILKVQRPQQLRERTSLAKEVAFLQALAAHTTVPVPRVLGYSHESAYLEYTCMTRMPGIAVVRTTLPPETRQAVLLDLGKTLRQIHQLPQESVHERRLFPGDHAAGDLETRLAGSFAEVVGELQREGTAWPLPTSPGTIVQQALLGLPASDERVALHSNPGATHTFVDAQTGTFTGLIDFGDAFISHPALDLRRWRSPEDRTALFAGYTSTAPVSDEFHRIWRVVMVLADMTMIAASAEHQDDLARDLTLHLAAL